MAQAVRTAHAVLQRAVAARSHTRTYTHLFSSWSPAADVFSLGVVLSMLVQGRQDPRIPWDGGVFKGTYRPSIREIVASLGKRNRCDQSESVTRKDEGVICRALNGCGTRDVIWCELPGVGHQWAGGKTILPRLLGNNTDKFNASAEVMRFFAKH